MGFYNVVLPDELSSFVAAQVESGRYEDASAVMQAALFALEREEGARRNPVDAASTRGGARHFTVSDQDKRMRSFLRTVKGIQARNAGTAPAELQRMVDEAVRSVRKDRANERALHESRP